VLISSGIPFSETTNKEISPPPSQTGEELIKLYLRNGSYITVKITETTTIDNLCEKIIEKYGQKPGAGQYINIYERVKNSGICSLFSIQKKTK
jgi:hypothetical protein